MIKFALLKLFWRLLQFQDKQCDVSYSSDTFLHEKIQYVTISLISLDTFIFYYQV